jgi:hypothetical protein
MDLRSLATALALASLVLPPASRAQEVIHNDEDLGSARPEAWAMNYMAAATLMTAFGATPPLAPGQWQIGADLGHIPRLDDSQQHVGFIGTKQEDLNRSPVFGRVRALVGLTGGFVAEVGYTPPLTIDGTKPSDMWALSLGRRMYERDAFSVSLRGFAQYGRVHGDITCPGRLANADTESNPYGCRAPSDDRLLTRLYGIDATGAWRAGGWDLHGTLGYARTDLEVQVDALTFDFRDRSLLKSKASWPYLALGANHDIDRNWKAGAELLYAPLKVQREIDGSTERDPLTSLRLRLSYRF